MKIQLSEILEGKAKGPFPIENKTLLYLSPCMRHYGEEFVERYKPVFKIALGISDRFLKEDFTDHIFILLYSGIKPKLFIDFLDWVRGQEYYGTDYVFGDMRVSPLHMLVLKCPEGYMQKFQLGKYSQMYSMNQIEEWFKKRPELKKVLLKSEGYHEEFVALINKRFNTDLLPEEYNGEYDFPPDLNKESFE